MAIEHGAGEATPGREDAALVPISALQHHVFCPRQCALIYLERQWRDNRLTVEGTDLHERVDETGRQHETRGDVRIARRLDLACRRLGLIGRADVVEFHRLEQGSRERGIALDGQPGRWQPFPVEYKRGRPKSHQADRVQLCAQALCLEEMLATGVPRGALYYAQPRRRTDVAFDAELIACTEQTAAAVHILLDSGRTPPATKQAKCRRCSLLTICLPQPRQRRSARAYLRSALERLQDPSTP